MTGTKVNPGERTETARAIRASLNEAAAAINGFHAQVLGQVIKAQAWKVHRDLDGFSALRDWLVSKFDFHHRTAADLAAIARNARKYRVLTETATTGAARVDQVAYAVRQLDKTPAMRLYARTPYREAVTSPFDTGVECPTPEHLVAQYCTHASHADLQRHLAEIEAACAGEDELFEGLSEQALARLEVWETENGMWAVDGLLSSDTGALFAKLLTTAVPPPRAEDCEADSADTGSSDGQAQAGTEGENTAGAEAVLPAQAGRNAEALHQMLATYGSDPQAPTRHGHTATLNLTCDLATLRGEATGRYPILEGQPVSVAKARLLACEAAIIPSIFNYTTGEAVELGRAERLPNAALRRKLELEQPEGCVWHGCGRPTQWTEAHHLEHWADGGKTEAANLILLCRFHHGRLHTPGWSATKTGPGTAVIVHHEGHEPAPADMTEDGQGGCGCPDWRTDTDLETEFASDAANVFPTGLYPTEWAPALKDDLNKAAETQETDRAWAAVKAARAKARARFTTETAEAAPRPGTEPERSSPRTPEPASTTTGPVSDPGPPPFLTRPPRKAPAAGSAPHKSATRTRHRDRAPRHARPRKTTPPHPTPTPSRRRLQGPPQSNPPPEDKPRSQSYRRCPVEARPTRTRHPAANPDPPLRSPSLTARSPPHHHPATDTNPTPHTAADRPKPHPLDPALESRPAPLTVAASKARPNPARESSRQPRPSPASPSLTA